MARVGMCKNNFYMSLAINGCMFFDKPDLLVVGSTGA